MVGLSAVIDVIHVKWDGREKEVKMCMDAEK